MIKQLSLSLIALLTSTVFMLGCSSSDGFSNSSTEESDQPSSFSLLSPKENMTIPYDHVTLEVMAADMRSLSAVNQSLVTEQNRTIKITGVDNNGTYYLYNLPLIQGKNEINITTISEANVSLSSIINLTSEANGSAPIGMRAGSYTGIGSLETIVEAGTLLHVKEYLFDNNGDGVIDETSTDGNFTVNYTKEGRYKPRVTVRTTEGVLYSNGNFALSLDVRADANQNDPMGAEPVDVAQAFVKAIIEDDRQRVEMFLMDSNKWIGMLYSNNSRREAMIEKLKNIDNNTWEQVYHPSGASTVTANIYDEDLKQAFPIGFELTPANFSGRQKGRFWFVRAFY